MVTKRGTASDDQLIGTDGDDYLIGLDGRDLMIGQSGNDIIDASGGSAASQEWGDIILPGLGSDIIIGHKEAWQLRNSNVLRPDGQAHSGIDLVYEDIGPIFGSGLFIRYSIDGSYGYVTSLVGADSEQFFEDYFTYADHIEGSQNDDIFLGSNQYIEGYVGESGNDIFNGRSYWDETNNTGWDYVSYRLENGSGSRFGIVANLSTGIATDTYGNTDLLFFIDEIQGSQWADKITGNNRFNVLSGFDGNDFLDGKGGNDTLYGGNNNDKLYGGSGNDKSYGEAGNDSLYMDAGNDTLDGGSGTDWVYVTGSTNSVVNLAKTTGQNTGYGTDIIKNIENASGGSGVDKFYGTSGNNTLKGNNGNDLLYGQNGNDTLYGGNNNDKLYGGSGNDLLKGDAGRDILQGDAGKDTLFGGADADTFVFRSTSDSSASASSADIIRDFKHGQDKIDLHYIDASTKLSGNNAFTFDGTKSFGTSKEGDIYYKQFNNVGTSNDYTMVYIDTDNDTGTEMSIKLMGLHALTASDFIL